MVGINDCCDLNKNIWNAISISYNKCISYCVYWCKGIQKKRSSFLFGLYRFYMVFNVIIKKIGEIGNTTNK